MLATTPAMALIVKTWEGPGTPSLTNLSAPADDPGWANLAENRAATYLGNGWAIGAQHNGGDNSIVLGGSTFSALDGTTVRLSNPSTFSARRQSNGTLTATSDITLFRVGFDENGMTPEDLDPAIRQIRIADRLANRSGDIEELTIFGRGRPRITDQSNVETGQFFFSSNGSILPTSTGSSYRGFRFNSTNPNVWQWGTNVRASQTSISGTQRSGSNILIEVNGLNDTVGFPIKFDEFGLDDEAQGAGGDSGGPVFWKDNDGEWVLAGLLHAVFAANNNSSLLGAFGSHTVISDLSYSTYHDEIEDLMAADLYGEIGDIDLDGTVTGNIVNDVATGDLAVLIDNWGYQAAEADIHTWIRGDLNRDARVDLGDFVLLRNALGGSISSSSFAQALAASAIPEPTTALLATIGSIAFATRRRR